MDDDPQARFCDDNHDFALNEKLTHKHAFFNEFV